MPSSSFAYAACVAAAFVALSADAFAQRNRRGDAPSVVAFSFRRVVEESVAGRDMAAKLQQIQTQVNREAQALAPEAQALERERQRLGNLNPEASAALVEQPAAPTPPSPWEGPARGADGEVLQQTTALSQQFTENGVSCPTLAQLDAEARRRNPDADRNSQVGHVILAYRETYFSPQCPGGRDGGMYATSPEFEREVRTYRQVNDELIQRRRQLETRAAILRGDYECSQRIAMRDFQAMVTPVARSVMTARGASEIVEPSTSFYVAPENDITNAVIEQLNQDPATRVANVARHPATECLPAR